MLCQVIIGSVGNPPKLSPSEGEQELDIGGCLRIEGQFFLVMVTHTHFLVLHAKALQPVNTELFPVCKPLKISIRLTEEFQLHLLKFSGTEGKVSGCDLITEGFTDLTDTERNFLTGSSLNILKVNKNTLCCFGSQIYGILCILRYTLKSLKHQVELADIGKIVLAAGRTGNIVVLNKCFHLFL